MSANSLSWGAYVAFVALALYFNWHPRVFAFDGQLGVVKLLVWGLFAGFLGYSIYCSSRENIFRSVPKISQLHWGRQIGADLYLGLLLALFVIYLNEGALAAALWLLPTLAFANLSILLYFGIHFDSIVAKFLG